MERSTPRGIINLAAALVIAAVMATSFLAGISIGHGSVPSNQYVIEGTPVPNDLHAPLDDLWQGYQRLNADSYWRPFDKKTLIYNAVSGMLDGCCIGHDTHTTFLPPVINAPVSQALNENSYGIGAEVVAAPGGLRIALPLIGSPSMRAGLRVGDLITAVNGDSILHVPFQTAVDRIHGPQGTVVTLTIKRAGAAKALIVRVKRDTIPSVISNTIGTVGYIQFYGFDVDTATEVHQNLQALLARHITGLIIDLRDNGGGYVTTAQAIASEFLPKDAVIFWERTNLGGGRYADAPTRVTAPGIAQHLPIAVLVDQNTASAAEILTAALREHGRAKVVGTLTYGKGSVQEDLPQPDGSSLRITIHLWLTPKKHSIDGVGIHPDLVVNPGPAGGPDLQEQAAIRVLGDRQG